MVKIGLEIHGYINLEQTGKKLFCECKAEHGEVTPNTNICPVCSSQPGSKPMLPNKEAIEKSVEIALMLGCKISPKLMFQRKHYNYPDLPSGYLPETPSNSSTRIIFPLENKDCWLNAFPTIS